ncbi:MAG: TIGR00304 family membrane protein [Thermoplasmata archaeon]
MRAVQLVGPAVLLAGLATLALAVARGEASLFLIVVIPAVVGTGPIAFLGILLVFAGFFLTFFLWTAGAPLPPVEVVEPLEPLASRPPQARRARRWGGVVFLGPIPLVFGSDPQMTRMMLVLGAILFLALLGLTLALLLV